MAKTEFIQDRQIYEKVMLDQIPRAKNFLWLGTSDIKDLHVGKKGRMVPFLEILSDYERNFAPRIPGKALPAREEKA